MGCSLCALSDRVTGAAARGRTAEEEVRDDAHGPHVDGLPVSGCQHSKSEMNAPRGSLLTLFEDLGRHVLIDERLDGVRVR